MIYGFLRINLVWLSHPSEGRRVTVYLAEFAEEMFEDDLRRFPALRSLHPHHLTRLKSDLLRTLEAHIDDAIRECVGSAGTRQYEKLLATGGREAAFAWCGETIANFESSSPVR